MSGAGKELWEHKSSQRDSKAKREHEGKGKGKEREGKGKGRKSSGGNQRFK